MSDNKKFSIGSFFTPSKMMQGIRNRGVKNAVVHGVRRMGARQEHAWVGPEVIRINPMGYVCNHTCPMCWLQHLPEGELKIKKKEDIADGMQLEEYQRLLDHLPFGVEEINIVGGGEPLIHKQIVEIMRAIKRSGLVGSLITNGTLLKQPIAEAMVEMRWDEARISVHAGDESTHSKIHGVSGRFEILRENLKTYSEIRHRHGRAGECRLLIFNVIQPDNVDYIPAMFRFAEDVRADGMVFERVIPYDDSQWLTPEQIDQARQTIETQARDCSVPANLEEILGDLAAESESATTPNRNWVPAKHCSVGFDHSFITANGDVFPCCFSNEKLGSLREQTFDEIWKSHIYQKFRERLINGKFARYCIDNRCALKGVLHND